jgi:putative thioredoxin
LEFQQGSQVAADTASLIQSVDQDPANLEIRYQLAQRLISEQQYSEGMDHLLEIIKRDRQFQDDAARRTILKVFEALGGHGDLVAEYRSKLSSVLF